MRGEVAPGEAGLHLDAHLRHLQVFSPDVRLGEDGLGEVEAYLSRVYIECRDDFDVPYAQPTDSRMPETFDSLSAPVMTKALNKGGGAVSDARDPHPDLQARHLNFATIASSPKKRRSVAMR